MDGAAPPGPAEAVDRQYHSAGAGAADAAGDAGICGRFHLK